MVSCIPKLTWTLCPKMGLNSWFSCLYVWNAGITDVCHHTHLYAVLGTTLRPLCMLGRHLLTKLSPQRPRILFCPGTCYVLWGNRHWFAWRLILFLRANAINLGLSLRLWSHLLGPLNCLCFISVVENPNSQIEKLTVSRNLLPAFIAFFQCLEKIDQWDKYLAKP